GTGALFTYTVDDGSSSSTEATVSVTVTAVNDVPVIGGVNGSTATYILTTAIPITFTGTITDVDSIFNGGTLTATIATNLTTGDQLAIEEDKYIRLWGASNNIVAYTPTGVNGTADRIGEWTGGTGTNPLVITFDKDAATSDAVQALLRRIAFSATNLGTGPRTVEFTLTDGDGGTSDTATVTINVVP
ncbi:MAG: hypothetical protein ACE5FD_09035, partial [Anaerolineae bacterium]